MDDKSLSVQQMMPRVLRGFGAITLSGGAGSGKTTFARAIALDASNPSYNLPFEFAKRGKLVGSAKLASTVFEFLGVFMSEGGRRVLNALDGQLYDKAMANLSAIEHDIRNTIRVEIYRTVGSSIAPERYITALAMSLQYHILRETKGEGIVTEASNPTKQAILTSFKDIRMSADEISRLDKMFEVNSDVATDVKGSVDAVFGQSKKTLEWLLEMVMSQDVPVNALVGWALDHNDLITPLQSNTVIMTHMVNNVAVPIADALTSKLGRVAVMRNEKMMRDTLLELVVSNESRRHVLISALVDGVEVSSTLTFEPMTVAKGLCFAFNVHLSTLNASYTRHMEGTTLSGGLPTTIPDAIQELNDTAAEIGSRFIIETRDDFVPKSSDSEEVEMFRNRFMASSRFSLYLMDKQGGNWRSRKYSRLDDLGDNIGTFRNHYVTYVQPIVDEATKPQHNDVWEAFFEVQDNVQ